MQIAIIPARGGSKRIPRKNILTFAGIPMIAHAIAAARHCGLFAKVIVSTDDEEISSIARAHGADTPFKRPAALADDSTPTMPVIAHGIRACQEIGWSIDYVCCIYPCVPFIRADDLQAALALLKASSADFSFPIAEFPSAIQRGLRQTPDGRVAPFFPEHELTRTQDLEPAYFDVGQFYWGAAQAWLKNQRVHSNGVGLPIPRWRAVDIDVPEDWQRAELMYDAILKSKTI
jgi:pseudaminic acid cytidylyltransferase